ncbi:MAG: sigma-54 dependent transcriptional regulator [Hyphomicrobiales bacterium]|nr:sigma-54 dependent transcriptional regulator [Hyphomicrobiales bacterium]OQW80946.1 MAG: sigma-54-dependent Fis family transcriptional regulator [Proteobacteria bacterium ST_bin15]
MRLMIVGTLRGQLSAATRIVHERGAQVTQADTIETALKYLRAGRGADLIMVDVALRIADLITALASEMINVPVVACGVSNDAAAAVAAIEAGAKEYIPLPPDPEMIAAIIAAVTRDTLDVVVTDETMLRVLRLAEQVAASEASVLITGESGSGKEVIARFLHKKSNRKDKPFIAINCAAMPEALLESELFGHEKGAFTGAVARRIGKFEEADGGTLLLDEISEMDVRLQAKLLRAIQERVIDRVGGSKPVPVNIRILATSNRNLTDEVKKGTFREDLLYRLNVVNLKLPALRQRPSDIMALAEHFIKKFASQNGLPPRPLSKEAKGALLAAAWPGNVRELENTMHRAVLLAMGPEIGVDAILTPEGTAMAGAGMAPRGPAGEAAMTAEAVTRALVGRTVSEVERDLILDTLDHCLGNRTHAANILGISIRTLRNKLNEYESGGFEVAEPGSQRGARTQQVA